MFAFISVIFLDLLPSALLFLHASVLLAPNLAPDELTVTSWKATFRRQYQLLAAIILHVPSNRLMLNTALINNDPSSDYVRAYSLHPISMSTKRPLASWIRFSMRLVGPPKGPEVDYAAALGAFNLRELVRSSEQQTK
jgi:hypothetical protein